jgi:hypothetical protein
MTGIMPYPKRQKTASGGGFKDKTPRASKIRHFSRQKPLFIRLKRVFAVSHFAHSDCLILLARQHQKETKAKKFSLWGERKSLALKINLGEKDETPIYPRLHMRTYTS